MHRVSRTAGPLALALLLAVSPWLLAQATQPSQRPPRHILSLTQEHDGQNFAAAVGERIEITLQSIGPQKWATPQISSSVVRFEDVVLKMPPNPGGPTQVFVFTAAEAGRARIQIPNTVSDATFSVMIDVAAARAGGSQAFDTPDQSNAAEWKDAWTNLLNDVRQTFTPSLPKLTRVEVDLVVGNPGPPADTLTMTILDEAGQPLTVVSKTVSAKDGDRVVFVIPGGGIAVSPGESYSIRLSGNALFGWKYVVGGYDKGAAYFNGNPLLRGAHSSFLFRTFGAS
ncbi:MAG TPA: hypothetical protein VMH04_20980 [Candidatus Solibacter sp.]|nr:hypothetical protein [Candidatus Solibacter sp.]